MKMEQQNHLIRNDDERRRNSLAPRSGFRIGIFTDTFNPQTNGIAISLQLLTRGLRASGHEVTVFTPRLPGYHDLEANIYRLPAVRYMQMPPVYIAMLGTPHVALKVRSSHFDVLHIHSPLTVGMLAYITACLKHIPVLYTYHVSMADYTHYLKFGNQTRLVLWATRWFSKITTNLSDQVVVLSAKFMRILNEQHVTRPIHLIPNGIDLENFQTSRFPRTYRRRLGLSPNAPLLLYVSRLAPEKWLDILIEAFDSVASEYADAHFVVAGDGSSRLPLEMQATASKYASRIHFLGMLEREDLPDLLHDATLFMSASMSEVHPIAMFEAAAAGLPIVVVWNDAFEGLLLDEQNGRVVSKKASAFAAAVCSVLADNTIRKAYGQMSRELSRKYSIEAQITALVELYKAAIDSNVYHLKKTSHNRE